MPAAWIGAGAAALGAVGSMSGGSGTSGGSGYYIPTGLADADQGWQNLQNQNIDFYNRSQLAQYGNTSLQNGFNALYNYAPYYQMAADATKNSYNALAGDMSTQANKNWGTQQALLNAGQQTYQTALDPQNALYNRTAQQLQDQTGATNSMYGLGSSAAGAGVANQAMSNFNIDWQNQQLQRQLQGLQGYTGAASTAGGYGQLANQQAALIPQYQLASGSTPYQTAQSIAAQPGQLGNTYGQYLNQNVYGPAQGFQGQAIPYMNYGQGAQAVPYQQQQQNAQNLGSTLSSALGGLGNSSQMTSAFSNAFGGNNSYGAQNAMGYGATSSPYYSGGGNSYGFTMS